MSSSLPPPQGRPDTNASSKPALATTFDDFSVPHVDIPRFVVRNWNERSVCRACGSKEIEMISKWTPLPAGAGEGGVARGVCVGANGRGCQRVFDGTLISVGCGVEAYRAWLYVCCLVVLSVGLRLCCLHGQSLTPLSLHTSRPRTMCVTSVILSRSTIQVLLPCMRIRVTAVRLYTATRSFQLIPTPTRCPPPSSYLFPVKSPPYIDACHIYLLQLLLIMCGTPRDLTTVTHPIHNIRFTHTTSNRPHTLKSPLATASI
jgi:hypothetical protein